VDLCAMPVFPAERLKVTYTSAGVALRGDSEQSGCAVRFLGHVRTIYNQRGSSWATDTRRPSRQARVSNAAQ